MDHGTENTYCHQAAPQSPYDLPYGMEAGGITRAFPCAPPPSPSVRIGPPCVVAASPTAKTTAHSTPNPRMSLFPVFMAESPLVVGCRLTRGLQVKAKRQRNDGT